MAKQAVVLVPAVPVTAPRTERTISMAALVAKVLRTNAPVETAVVGVRQVDGVVRVTGMRILIRAIAIFAMTFQQKVPLQRAPGTLFQMTPVKMSRISCFAKQKKLFLFQHGFDVICSRAGVRSVYVYVL